MIIGMVIYIERKKETESKREKINAENIIVDYEFEDVERDFIIELE